MCYSEYYVEGNTQQAVSGIASSMKCVTVNIMRNLLHSGWTVLLQLEWSVIQ